MMRDYQHEESDRRMRWVALVSLAIGLWALGTLVHWLWSLASRLPPV